MFDPRDIESHRAFSASVIIPKEWYHQFMLDLSNTSHFTWGDNNVTLVSATRFADACENNCEEEDFPGLSDWLKKVREIDSDIYINLEG